MSNFWLRLVVYLVVWGLGHNAVIAFLILALYGAFIVGVGVVMDDEFGGYPDEFCHDARRDC